MKRASEQRPDGRMGGDVRTIRTMAKGKPRIYVSFDVEHDMDLYERLVEQSKAPGSSFIVSAASERSGAKSVETESLRRRICEVDQVIVICGEHTGSSVQACADLSAANEERTPYFLLWGRSHTECTKPVGAKNDDGMYRWTPQILQEQIAVTARRGRKPPA
jgi:hypothetical protein